VKKNAILMIDFALETEREGAPASHAVREAFEFNSPLKLLASSPSATTPTTLAASLLASPPPVCLTPDSSAALVLETVKRGEDDEDLSTGDLPARKGRSVVLRMYDSLGGRARGTVATTWAVRRVCKVNLLEDELEEVVFVRDEAGGGGGGEGGRFEVDLRPFEVASFRLELVD
jgi:alpha-mannosidase